MKLYKMKDYDQMSKKAAFIIAAQVTTKPNSVLGLATGSTPVGTYGYLKEWYQTGVLDFSEIKTVNLDEYKGLGKDDEQSYAYFMKEQLFNHINIKEENTYIQNGLEQDSEKVCEAYEALIQSLGGVDLQLLGLGQNGHIGFNEPAEQFAKKCHCIDLTESTIEANKRFFEKAEDVPKQSYTMGIGTVMSAKKILMLVSGEEKADALKQALCGAVTPKVPASILQFHPDVTIIADEAALSKLDK